MTLSYKCKQRTCPAAILPAVTIISALTNTTGTFTWNINWLNMYERLSARQQQWGEGSNECFDLQTHSNIFLLLFHALENHYGFLCSPTHGNGRNCIYISLYPTLSRPSKRLEKSPVLSDRGDRGVVHFFIALCTKEKNKEKKNSVKENSSSLSNSRSGGERRDGEGRRGLCRYPRDAWAANRSSTPIGRVL